MSLSEPPVEIDEAVDVDRFRVLVVDDDDGVRAEILRQIGTTAMVPFVAATAEQAYEIIEKRYIDAAIVDIALRGVDAGREILRVMSRYAPAATAVIATQYTDRLGDFIGLQRPRLSEIVSKGPDMARNWAVRPLDPIHQEWKTSEVTINGVDLIVSLLEQRSARIERLRPRTELTVEIDRLCRRLFGAVAVDSESGDASVVSIDVKPIQREGLSAAITVEAEVRLGRDHAAREMRGSRVVLKFGRSADIAIEAERYHTFVKYGVPLSHRVELLGHAEDQALGAICYSFAGNVFGSTLEALDEQLRAPDRRDLVGMVLYSLFSGSAKSWYDVTGEPVAPNHFIAKTYKTKFESCDVALKETLKHLQRRFGADVNATLPDDRTDGSLAVGQAQLRLPRTRIWGTGIFLKTIPSCLVHGDMHGGNVMVELDGDPIDGDHLRRVCLIDYRNVGFGPRTTDFVALQASTRLADLQQILAEYAVDHENDLTEDDFRLAVMACAGRVRDERKVITAGWSDVVPRSLSTDAWATTSVQLTALARKNFVSLTLEEYLAMALPSAHRHIGYSIGVLGRVRFAAWLSALYERLPQST